MWACRPSYIINGNILSSDLNFSWIKVYYSFSAQPAAQAAWWAAFSERLKTAAGAVIWPPFHRTAATVNVLLWLLLTGPFSSYCTFTTLSIQKDFWECFCLCWKAKTVLSAIILQPFKSNAPRFRKQFHFFNLFFYWTFDIGHFFLKHFIFLSTSCRNQCISM